jgi:hypothetical protein
MYFSNMIKDLLLEGLQQRQDLTALSPGHHKWPSHFIRMASITKKAEHSWD